MTDSAETHSQDCDCFRCKIRTIQVSPRATPSRTRKYQKGPKEGNSWEKGIAFQRDNMPYLLPGSIEPMPIKTYVENRQKINEAQRKARQSPQEG